MLSLQMTLALLVLLPQPTALAEKSVFIADADGCVYSDLKWKRNLCCVAPATTPESLEATEFGKRCLESGGTIGPFFLHPDAPWAQTSLKGDPCAIPVRGQAPLPGNKWTCRREASQATAPVSAPACEPQTGGEAILPAEQVKPILETVATAAASTPPPAPEARASAPAAAPAAGVVERALTPRKDGDLGGVQPCGFLSRTSVQKNGAEKRRYVFCCAAQDVGAPAPNCDAAGLDSSLGGTTDADQCALDVVWNEARGTNTAVAVARRPTDPRARSFKQLRKGWLHFCDQR